jgi:ribokinase
MASAGPIVVVGSANADCYVEVDRLPRPGETISAGGQVIRPGGKGANQAVAAARLGASVEFIGQIGDDEHGALLHSALLAEGVGLQGLRRVSGHASGQALILLQSDGENAIMLHGGANLAWSGLHPEQHGLISSAAMVLLQREVPLAINLAVCAIARAASVPVVLDAGGANGPAEQELLPGLACCSPNETELARVPGGVEGILAAGCTTVLVKQGADGLSYADSTGSCDQAAFGVDVIDTTGAGDAATAAWAVARSCGLSVPDALAFAAAAGACCVRNKGALSSMPTRTMVEALLGKNG